MAKNSPFPIPSGQDGFVNRTTMILYDPHIPASLAEFGIQIPIRDSRSIRTFQALLKLTLAQMFERDRLLYTWLNERNVPAVFLMAGGYGDEVWRVYAQFLRWVLPRRYLDLV